MTPHPPFTESLGLCRGHTGCVRAGTRQRPRQALASESHLRLSAALAPATGHAPRLSKGQTLSSNTSFNPFRNSLRKLPALPQLTAKETTGLSKFPKVTERVKNRAGTCRALCLLPARSSRVQVGACPLGLAGPRAECLETHLMVAAGEVRLASTQGRCCRSYRAPGSLTTQSSLNPNVRSAEAERPR